MKRKLLSLLLSLIMVVACLPMNIVGAAHVIDDNRAVTIPTISVVGTFAKPGSTVNVDLKIADNPGIAGARITLTYDAGLTLTDAVSGPAFEMLDFTRPGTYASPCNFSWDSESAVATDDGTILTLTFTVAEDVSADDNLAINVSYQYGDIYDTDLNDITVSMVGSYIDVIDFIYGDVNDDGTVNGKDVTLIRRCIAGGYDISINEQAADVNCDGTINGKDVTLIRRYIAGGYDIELPVPVTPPCNHNLEHVEAAPATCTQDGNIEYWHCTICGKCFSDANGSHEITQASTVIPATGHSFSTDWSSDSTYHWHAATCEHENEMSDRAEHTFNADNVCTVCGYDNNPVPGYPYHIEFRIYEYNTNLGDDYIGTQAIDNSANEEHLWFSSTETFELKSISCPGYTFLGWYTPDGDRMTSVPVGTNHDLILYARWSEIVYDITYRVYMTPIGEITDERYLHYTVNKGLQDLPNPSIYNYEFLGWYTDVTESCDECQHLFSESEMGLIKCPVCGSIHITKNGGKALTKIPVGTTGDITLNAYWTSFRNLAKKIDHVGDPTILVDNENGRIYFTYELGTIENVPISDALVTIQGVDGLNQLISREVTTSISESVATQITQTVSHVTTDSKTWRLSEEWNDSVHVDEGWAQERGLTVEEAETILKGQTNSYSITTENGGSSTSTSNTGTTTVTYDSQNNNGNSGAAFTHETSHSTTDTDHVGIESKLTSEMKVPGVGKISGEISGDMSNDYTVEHGGKDGSSSTYSSGYDKHSGKDTTSINTHTNSNTSTWNNSSTSSVVNESSQSNTVSHAMSEVLSSVYNVGTDYMNGGSESEEVGFSSSDSEAVSTATTITYTKSETTTTTRTYSSDGKSHGWYRLVIAGRFHVFGVVGYDVASKSYFTYTYSIMEDNTYDFLDYSPYSSFDDDEHTALPFNIPYDICDYVNEMIAETDGLLLRTNTNDHTATVVGYVGTDDEVQIPSFYSTGGYSYRVTGLSASAFAGTDIKAIILSEYMDEIPDCAFKNCTKLESVFGAFTKIGSEAFSGCTKLTDFKISSAVTSVGENAFYGVPEVSAKILGEDYAIFDAFLLNPDATHVSELLPTAKELTQIAASDIVGCGTECLSIDLSLTTDGTVFTIDVGNMSSFEIVGGGKVFPDMRIESEAGSTILRNFKINDCSRIPLVISSDEITLDRVTVNSTSFALLAQSQNVNITMVRDNLLSSTAGNAVVCKNPTLISEVSTRATIGVLDVSGNVYVCGNPPIPGVDYLDVTNGEIIYITDDQFNSLIRGCFTVTFDPNGGSVSTTSKDVEFGAKYGTLPTPTRATFDFMGWYTDPYDGTLVTADTVSTVIYDQTLYAHWELKQYTVTFNANGGSVSPTTMAAVIGTAPSSLPTPTRTGHTFAGWYTAASGGTQVTVSNWNTVIGGMDATTLVTNGLPLYAHWTVNSFTVTWSNGTGYTITVKRTSSPYAGASTGGYLSSGATVYYGDVLTVTYTPATGYSIATHGSTSITVTGNVNSSTIYATASANSYTYNIVYRSVNGTSLGSTTITKTWGTTTTVSAPDKTSQGYSTPASQTVVWDSTTPKTITFTYGIIDQTTSAKTGTISSSPHITYSCSFEYRNRTATTVQVRLVWTTTIAAYSWTVYGQQLNASTNAGSSSVQVAAFNTWASSVSYGRTATGTTGWMTVNLSTTNKTTASISYYYYQFNSNGTNMYTYDGTPHAEGTWTMNIPAY